MIWLRKHKIWGLALLLVVASGSCLVFANQNNPAELKAHLTTIKRGSLVATVTGSGHVSANHEINLTSEVAAEVLSVPVKNGQAVNRGALLVALEATEANLVLERAKIQLTKLKEPHKVLELLQAENAIEDAKAAQVELTADLAAAYNEAFNALVETYLDLPDLATGLDDIFDKSTLSDNAARLESNQARAYRNQASDFYYHADRVIKNDLKEYRLLTRESPRSAINAMIHRGQITGEIAADAVKALRNFVDYMADRNDNPSQTFDTEQASLATYTEETNTHLAKLLASENELARLGNELIAASRAIRETEEELVDLRNGADALDLKTAELEIKEKEEAYQNYFIRAPFPGVVAKLQVKVGDRTTVGHETLTFITNDRLAEIPLNEVDAAKVIPGQKAKLTLEAIPELELTGTIIEVATLGTVENGVATYLVKISLETTDQRVRPGMSVEAQIEVENKNDILLVPTTAIRVENGKKYVTVLDKASPQNREIVTGLEGETQTEVISGLIQGVEIVLD